MARPRYETEEHLEAERAVAETLEDIWQPLKAHQEQFHPLLYKSTY